MQLIDLYRSRFGQAVKRNGNGWNGPCPLCGGQSGKSDRFMVWPERADHLGDVCSTHGIKGIWYCRKCGATGDTIAWLTKVEGMSFNEALSELGIEGAKMSWRRRKAPAEPVSHMHNAWSPKIQSEPSVEWQERAHKLVEEAEKKIWDHTGALNWLRARGICEATIKKYRLGYLDEESEKYHGRFRPRKSFGLPSKTGQDGKVHDKLFIPRGILIPTFDRAGDVLNLRVRRHKADLGERMPKYMELEGSCKGSFFLPSSLPRPIAVYFITEAELDAMLIHHASGGVVGAVAVRTNRGKPDARCNPSLESAARICIALDYDNAGAEGCDFWEENYANSVRWPVPEGKDPGDAFALGVDIREWIAASLPESVSLPEYEGAIHGSSIAQVNQESQEISEHGRLEASASGQNNLGEGASPNLKYEKGKWPSEARARINARAMAPDYNMEGLRWKETQPEPYAWASESDFTPRELALLNAALPKDTRLDDIYLDVAVIWLLWRNLPVAFISHHDEQGNCTGFEWEYDYSWEAKNHEKFEMFFRHQYTSRAFWRWISDHPAEKVTYRNLLNLWELLAQKYENNGAE